MISFDKKFLESEIAQERIFKSKRTGVIHNFTMGVDRGYKYIEKFRRGLQWLRMESKNFISNISSN